MCKKPSEAYSSMDYKAWKQPSVTV